jgi:hypothetical protein
MLQKKTKKRNRDREIYILNIIRGNFEDGFPFHIANLKDSAKKISEDI